ncbi:MAG: hypothetical protein QMB62_00740 [Oscillospiraceae bacterium]
MSISAAAAVKIAASVLTNDKLRKTVGWIIAAVLSPLILLLVIVCSFMSGGADHNAAALDLSYYGGMIAGTVPEAYRQHITDMQNSLAIVDGEVTRVNAMSENGSGLDSQRVKAIFYSLYFGAENPTAVGIGNFVDCFVIYEQRTDPESGDIYTVAVPVSLETVYANIQSVMGVEITDAVRKNADEVYARTHSGGDTFSGEYARGDGVSIELDSSAFTDPATKNNLDLVTYAENAWKNGWGYVWGTYGSVLTDSLFASKLAQYPDGVGSYEDFIRENWLGRRTTDCVGLIKGYGWLDISDMSIGYGINGMPDVGADQMYANANVKGDMSSMPDTPGLAVWHSGHIGVYIGNGEVIEAMGTRYGVVKTKLSERSWTAWLEVPYINYITESEVIS